MFFERTGSARCRGSGKRLAYLRRQLYELLLHSMVVLPDAFEPQLSQQRRPSFEGSDGVCLCSNACNFLFFAPGKKCQHSHAGGKKW